MRVSPIGMWENAGLDKHTLLILGSSDEKFKDPNSVRGGASAKAECVYGNLPPLQPLLDHHILMGSRPCRTCHQSKKIDQKMALRMSNKLKANHYSSAEKAEQALKRRGGGGLLAQILPNSETSATSPKEVWPRCFHEGQSCYMLFGCARSISF
ncbi:hypothetical protein JCGZ_11872 [Jatropha curcas]|uniref:Uncharacterized protein n=1 Tax=Jatropha curcas TaxID=180498 RepID=A0A067LNC1_JATCU|nr:hypothetical protein JCGZ_11872 [Jatropha curcas]